MKDKTEAARAAIEIRKLLKKKFPGAKFYIRSKNYTGGDSIYITWSLGPTRDMVENAVAKYQYGYYDASEDLYKYSNARENIPQVKFVFTTRDYPKDLLEQIMHDINKLFNINAKLSDRVDNDYQYMARQPYAIWYDIIVEKLDSTALYEYKGVEFETNEGRPIINAFRFKREE